MKNEISVSAEWQNSADTLIFLTFFNDFLFQKVDFEFRVFQETQTRIKPMHFDFITIEPKSLLQSTA